MSFYSNSFGYTNRLNPNTLFPQIERMGFLSDFFVRLDLIGILASVETTHIETFIRQSWSNIFPNIRMDYDIERNCLTYFEKYRFGFKLMSKGEDIQKNMLILHALVPAAILLRISQNESETIELQQVKSDVIINLKPVVNDKSAVDSCTNNILKQYFGTTVALSEETYTLIKQYRSCIKNFFDTLCSNMLSRKKNKRKNTAQTDDFGDRQTLVSNTNKSNHFNTPIRFMRIMCLLYLALENQDSEKPDRDILIKEQWPKVFGSSELTPEVLDDMNLLISSELDLKAVNMLFKYSMKEIRSGRIVRRIVVSLCVNQVLSRLPHNSSADLVIDESLSLLSSRFDALSIGKEESDIEEYLRRFVTIDGTVDDRISKLLWKHSSVISDLFNTTVESINVTDSARQQYWWEEILNKKEKQVSSLQSQIDITKINTVYDLIETLCGSSYNYVLSRLYRFAYGFDTLSAEEIRLLLKRLLQVFQLFGVKTTGEELIGKLLTDDSVDETGILTVSIADMKSNQVLFPGWNVSGDTVILPIASNMEEKEENV